MEPVRVITPALRMAVWRHSPNTGYRRQQYGQYQHTSRTPQKIPAIVHSMG